MNIFPGLPKYASENPFLKSKFNINNQNDIQLLLDY